MSVCRDQSVAASIVQAGLHRLRVHEDGRPLWQCPYPGSVSPAGFPETLSFRVDEIPTADGPYWHTGPVCPSCTVVLLSPWSA